MGKKKSKNRTFKSASKIPLKEFTAMVTASTAAPPPPPWIDLPGDLTADILGRLGAKEILRSAQFVCTTWWKICHDPAMWRVLCLLNLDRDLCRRAVDCSQGQLFDLSLYYVCNEELIEYIAQRSSNLKRLTLYSYCCFTISGECLAEAVKRLPQLEELHLNFLMIEGGDVKNIGISCPKLKSFSYNERLWLPYLPYPGGEEDDDILEEEEEENILHGYNPNELALAVGESMPNLRHLQLRGNCMRNPGLEAILDGCPHLESLDIRQCSKLNLKGHVGKRCCNQIKDLRLPYDSVSDVVELDGYPFELDSYSPCYEREDDDDDFFDEDETYDDFGFFDSEEHALNHAEVFDPDYF